MNKEEINQLIELVEEEIKDLAFSWEKENNEKRLELLRIWEKLQLDLIDKRMQEVINQ